MTKIPPGVATAVKLILLYLIGLMASQDYFSQLKRSAELVESFERVIPPNA